MNNKNIVGYCLPDRKADKTSPFNIGEFLSRILLFDKVYLKCVRLNEIATIVEKIGPEQTIELIESGSLKFIVDSLNVAATGQNAVIKSRKERGGPLPLGSYAFHVVNVRYGKDETSKILNNVRPENYLIEKRLFQKLKLAVVNNIIESPDEVRYGTMASIVSDIKNNIDAIPFLINEKLKEKNDNSNLTISDIEVRTFPINELDFKIETNLNSILGLHIEEEHEIVQRALLGLGTFNRRLMEMKAYESITCFDEKDYKLFDLKYQFILRTLAKQHVQNEMSRVVNIVGLPDFSEVGLKHQINIKKLLKLKETDEYQLFRNFGSFAFKLKASGSASHNADGF